MNNKKFVGIILSAVILLDLNGIIANPIAMSSVNIKKGQSDRQII